MKLHRFIRSFCIIDGGEVYVEGERDISLDLDLLILLWQVLVIHTSINSILIRTERDQIYAQKVREGSTVAIFADQAASLALIYSTYQKIAHLLSEGGGLLDDMRRNDLGSILSDLKEPEGVRLDTNKELVMTIEEIKRFREEWNMTKSFDGMGGVK